MTKTTLGATLCCLCLIEAGAAHAAADPNRIAMELAAAAAATGDVEITYDKVSGSGDTITLTNVKVTSTGAITGNDKPATAPATATPAPAGTTAGAKPATGSTTATATASGAKPATGATATSTANGAKPATGTTTTATANGAKPATGAATATANGAKPATGAATATATSGAKPGTPVPAAPATAAASASAVHTTMLIPALVITGAAERPMGGFTAKHIAFDAASTEAPEGNAKWATGSLDDVIVPSTAEIDAHAKIRPFGSVTLGSLSFTEPKKADAMPVTIASVNVTVGNVSDTMPAVIHLVANGAKMPVAFVSNPIGSAMLTRMGYTEFDANLTLDATYDTAQNSVALNSLMVDAQKVGKLAMSVQLSDTSLGGIADPTQASGARSAARLDSISIRFDDAGFVGRMLDMQAELVGGSRTDVVDGLVNGALPFVLNYVQNTAFRQQFSDAAEAFLTNPKNITITAKPAMPVPLGEVLRTAVADPLKLPDLLSPQVAANK
jgi:hypothetical protein